MLVPWRVYVGCITLLLGLGYTQYIYIYFISHVVVSYLLKTTICVQIMRSRCFRLFWTAARNKDVFSRLNFHLFALSLLRVHLGGDAFPPETEIISGESKWS